MKTLGGSNLLATSLGKSDPGWPRVCNIRVFVRSVISFRWNKIVWFHSFVRRVCKDQKRGSGPILYPSPPPSHPPPYSPPSYMGQHVVVLSQSQTSVSELGVPPPPAYSYGSDESSE